MAGFGAQPSFGDYRSSLSNVISLSYLTGVPDPSQIANPTLIVIFKNLLKRDSTTKEKALVELLSFIDSNNDDIINDSHFQRCWVLIYSKLSIDVSISVRSHSHKIQGSFCKLLGKLSAKHLKDTIGPWIAGTFDIDRTVALSAQQSLDQAFPSPEKQDALYNIFEESLLDFVINTIKNESPQSLSDERYVSADDSEAKFFRVIKCCISILSKLIGKRYESSNSKKQLPSDAIVEKYRDILGYSKLWKLSYSSDISVSKSILDLTIILVKPNSSANELILDYLPDIASNVVYKSLKSSQGLVATSLLQALIALTRKFPSIWDLANSSSKKSSAFSTLCKFIALGSRRSNVYYWPSLLALLTALPENISPYNASNKTQRDEVVTSIYQGVLKEPLLSKHHGWGAYLTVVEKSAIANNDESNKIVRETLTNLMNELIIKPTRLSPDVVQVVSKKLSNFISLDWSIVEDAFTIGINDVLKRKSYESLSNFITIVKSLDPSSKQKFSSFLTSQISALFINLKSGLDVFEIHVISSFLAAFEKLLFPNDSLTTELYSFISDSLSSFIVSDANADLIKIVQVYATHGKESIQKSAEESFTCIIKSSFEDKKLIYLSTFLKAYSSFKGLIKPIDSLSQYIRYLLYISEKEENSESIALWDSILYGIASHGVFVSEEAADDGLTFFCTITDVQPSEKSLWVLQKLLVLDNDYFTNFISTAKGKEFFSYLWTIESQSVERLLNAIETPSTGNFNVLCEGLLEELENNTSIDMIQLLVERGQRLISSNESKDVFKKLLTVDTNRYLEKVFSAKVNTDLAVADSLDGAILLVESDTEEEEEPDLTYKLTSMAAFSKSLISDNNQLFFSLQTSAIQQIALFLGYSYEIISSSVFLGKINTSDNEIGSIVFQITNDLNEFIKDLYKSYSASQFVSAIESADDALQDNIISSLWVASATSNNKGYYSTRLLATIFNTILNSTNDDSQIEPLITRLRPQFKKSPLGTTALLYGFQKYLLQFQALNNLRNQFASELIGLSSEKLSQTGLKNLIYLNLLLDVSPNEVTAELIPLNRLLMFLTPVLSWHQSDGFDARFMNPRIELTKLLTKIVSLYSTRLSSAIWESCIEVLEQNFISMSECLPLKYYNLRYIITLQKLVPTVPDLEDIWNEKSDGIYEELFDVLYAAEASSDQPETLTNLQLQKAISTVPTGLLDYDRVYKLLSIPSCDIQRTAFVLLNRYIPSLQEDRSIEYELQKSKITDDNDSSNDSDISTFSDSLLSIVREAPDETNDSSITAYLWSWQLIYDHFKNASYDLRRAYINKLRNYSNILDSLLDLISNYIVDGSLNKIAEKNKQLDIINNYNGVLVEEISEEIELLLIRSYFLTLQYTGSLAKSWFLNTKKRSVILGVEKFTEKYISPLIIKRELDNVEVILESANSSLNDETLSAKIIRSINEVRAYYTTDEQTMEIAIKIPVLYPLRDLQVEGIKRIGVREKQWRAWLLASQAIGTAQNGSIIDSLELFKRNVSMHFEGIDECAICYSILHEDHSLPNKTCTTCKKKFHADCLYKWFKSAGSSSCPLCRTTFSFRHGIN